MKTNLILLITIVLAINADAQAPNWVWANVPIGAEGRINAVTTDATGSLYNTGYFSGNTITFGTVVLNNAGVNPTKDAMITKYSKDGNIIWAKRHGGTGNDVSNSVATDAVGNVYEVGYFYSASIIFGTTTLTNTGSSNIYIVKYDSTGTIIWAKKVGGTVSDAGNAITADATGIYITGSFSSGTLSFGTLSLTNTNNLGVSDIFVAKYDFNGNEIWAKSAGGVLNDYGNSIASDGSGVYITGTYSSATISFGSTTLTNTAGGSEIFVVKYDSNGNLIWAKSEGGSSNDSGIGIAADASGVYTTGSFSSATMTVGTTTLTNAGHSDIYLIKYSSSGTVMWATSQGGGAYDEVKSISVYASEIYITGNFTSDTLDFGTTQLYNSTNSSYYDLFVVKYNSSGGVQWAKRAGGASWDQGTAITADAYGTYVGGTYYSYPFVLDTLNVTTIIGSLYEFIAKLSSTTGITELNSESTIVLFPNPATSILTINTDNVKIESMKIYNVLGCEMLNQVQHDEHVTIDVSGFSNGIYFIEAETEKGILRKKVVKE